MAYVAPLITKTFDMLKLLRKHRFMKMAEIETALDSNERQVRRYKWYLKEFGITVTGIAGQQGGYRLDEPYLNHKEFERR